MSVWTSVAAQSAKNQRALVWACVLAACLAVGGALFRAPVVAWVVLGALLGILLLRTPPAVWVGSAVLLSVVSRVVVAAGLAPSILNFFHFPLAIGSALVASIEPGVRGRLKRQIGFGIVGLLAASLLSWAANGGEIARPLLTWLVFGEGFLILYALVKVRLDERQVGRLWLLALVLAVIQLPLAVWQAATLGLGDTVAGTFIAMGAGAHVAGAVALLGTLVSISRAMASRKLKHLAGWLALGVALLLVPVLSDAKQSFVAFLIASAMLIRVRGPYRWVRKPAVLGFLVLASVWILVNAHAFKSAVDLSLVREGLQGKIRSYDASVAESGVSGWLLGLGPGNSVSRVALMGMESYAKIDSPVRLIGLKPARLTQQILSLTQTDWLMASSSAWSGISSWLGLFGDLGLLGVIVYLWVCWCVWRFLGRSARWECVAGSAALVMAGLLGGIFSWLEEPGYILLVALIAGLGVVAAREDGASQYSPRS